MKIGNEFIRRRRYLLDQLGKTDIAILFSAKEVLRNGDGVYPYRQDSDFYYLTGFLEPESIAVFVPGRKDGEFVLFNNECNPEMNIWFGARVGQNGACCNFGADQSFKIEEADAMLPDLIMGRDKIYYNAGVHCDFDSRVIGWAKQLSSMGRQGINVPTDLINIGKIVHEMRLVKDETEIFLLRKAVEISATAHLRAMCNCKPGKYEYELEADLVYDFYRHGGRSVAFESIVASGKNACTLHYMRNDSLIRDGDLVLIDAGVEYKNYASDISRTFPANGRFTKEQRAVYEAVLHTQKAVIAAIKPGVSWIELQYMSERLITERLLELGILQGDVDKLYEQHEFHRFYMHRIGHWIGLDDHDVGRYKIGEHWRLLEPGMVLTVEPGIYIRNNQSDVDKKWWNIGVRIEDTILVTDEGSEILSFGVPKEVDEIEAVMSAR